MNDYRNWAIGLLTAMLLAFGGVFWAGKEANASALRSLELEHGTRLTYIETVLTIELTGIKSELKAINTKLDQRQEHIYVPF